MAILTNTIRMPSLSPVNSTSVTAVYDLLYNNKYQIEVPASTGSVKSPSFTLFAGIFSTDFAEGWSSKIKKITLKYNGRKSNSSGTGTFYARLCRVVNGDGFTSGTLNSINYKIPKGSIEYLSSSSGWVATPDTYNAVSLSTTSSQKVYSLYYDSKVFGDISSLTAIDFAAGTYGMMIEIGYAALGANPVSHTIEMTDVYLEIEYESSYCKISHSTNNSSYGTTSGSSGLFQEGVEVTLYANQNVGYNFEGWYKGSTLVSNKAEYSFIVADSGDYEARFTDNITHITSTNQQNKYTLNLSTSTNKIYYKFTPSTTRSFIFKSVGGHSYDPKFKLYNSSKTLIAENDDGDSTFDFYLVQTLSVGLDYYLEVRALSPGNFDFIIEPEQKTILVTTQNSTYGTVQGAGTYYVGEWVTITATQQIGYNFKGWYDGNDSSSLISNSLTYKFKLASNSPLSYKAYFTSATNLQESNSVSVRSAFEKVYFKFTPSVTAKYKFESTGTVDSIIIIYDNAKNSIAVATGGGSGNNFKVNANLDEGSTYYIEVYASGSNTGNYSFTVEQQPVTITASSSDTTKGTVSGGGAYNIGNTVYLTAEQNIGYNFDGWYRGNSLVSTSLSFSFSASADQSYTAKFSDANSFSLNTNYSVSHRSADEWVYYKFTPSTTADYLFVSTGSGSYYNPAIAIFNSNKQMLYLDADGSDGKNFKLISSLTGGSTYYIGVVEESYSSSSYTFSAKINTATVSVSISNSNAGSIKGGGSYTVGENATIETSQNTDSIYNFDGWYKDGVFETNLFSYTFTVTENVSYQAKYSIPTTAISMNTAHSVTITNSNERKYFKFVPPNTAKYIFESTGSVDPKIQIYNSSGVSLGNSYYHDDQSSANRNFKLIVELTKNTTYYIGAYIHSTGTGTYSFSITYGQYTISVNSSNTNYGTVTGGGDYTYGGTASLGASAATGYKLDGWYLDNSTYKSNNNPYNITVTGDASYTARFSAQSYTYNIVYKSKNGQQLGTSTVSGTYGETKTISPANFTGYTPPANQTVTWDATSKTITFDQYTPIEYAVSYDLKGGSLAEGVTNVSKYTIEDTFTLNNPSKEGYTFEGWTGTDLNKVTKNVTVQVGKTGARSYEANYKPISYSITYNLAGGSWPEGTTENKSSYTIEESFTLPKPEKKGWTFIGWTGTGLTQATKTVTVSSGSIGARSYTANYSVNQYTFTLDKDNYTTVAASQTGLIDYGTRISLQATPIQGYKFVQWESSNTTLMANITSASTGFNMPDGNLTLKGTSQPEEYTITYDGTYHATASDVVTNVPSQQKYTYSTSGNITLSDTVPQRNNGYTFAGWTTTKNATEATYSAGSLYAKSNIGNITLYAVWKKDITLSYNINGGNGDTPSPQTVTIYNKTTSTTFKNIDSGKNISKPGHSFGGWSTTQNGSAVASYTFSNDITLWAIWDMGYYTVTLEIFSNSIKNADGNQLETKLISGTLNSSNGKYEYNSVIEITAIPYEYNAYNFSSWEQDGVNKGTSITQRFTVENNTTIKAFFATGDVSVQFNCYDITSSFSNPTLISPSSEEIRLWIRQETSRNSGQYTSWQQYSFQTPLNFLEACNIQYLIEDGKKYKFNNKSNLTSLNSIAIKNQVENIWINSGNTVYAIPCSQYMNKNNIYTNSSTPKTKGFINIPYFSSNGEYDWENISEIWIGNSQVLGKEPSDNYPFLTSTLLGENLYIGSTETQVANKAYNNNTAIYNLTIPSSITLIDSYGFNGCSNLTKVKFLKDSQLITINARAFYNNKCLLNVYLPEKLQSIKDQVFYGCSNLNRITFPNSLIEIGEQSFRGCQSLKEIRLDSTKITSLPTYSFYGCKELNTIFLPNTITTIGSYAFYSCSKLKTVIYRGTIAEWNNISITTTGNTNYLLKDTTIICKDGVINY